MSIVSSGHDVADARLHREARALAARGLSVEVLGLGAAADGPPGAGVRTWERPGLVGRAVLALRQPYLARGAVLLTLDPDSGVAAALARRVRPRPLVVDVHEDYRRLLADRPWAASLGSLPRVAAQSLVGYALRTFARADLVVVADEHVPPERAVRRLVVRNLPDYSLLPVPGAADAAPRALYIGDLRASRGLFAMVEAVRRAPGWTLDLVGPVAAADQGALDELLRDPDLASRVRLHGRRPPQEAWALAAGAWVGLSLLRATPAFVDAVPSKLYEYLACGLPVLSTDLPRPAALVRDAAGGPVGAVVAGGADEAVAEAVAGLLRGWTADSASYAVLRERVRARALASRSGRTPYDDLADAVAALVPTHVPADPPDTSARPPSR